MTNTIDSEAAAASAGPGPATAGRKLRAAREAAGLSLDAVAQQLKLAPRQVKALEDDDFQRLPGRTFVRGFARNYARFVQLDPDAVLALLPGPEHAPALERPTLAAARRPMGEIPVDRVSRPSAARWLFALLLAVVIAAAGYYEYTRQQSGARRDPDPGAGAGSTATPARPPRSTTSGTAPGTTTMTLPNPVSESPPSAPTVEGKESAAAAGATSVATAEPGGGAAATTASGALVLAFRGTSWAEVKDANGRVILQMTGGPGMTQTVSGTPPYELALGNAPEVTVTFRGQSLDLAPYTRGSVARVALK